jgi:hypothetical protein
METQTVFIKYWVKSVQIRGDLDSPVQVGSDTMTTLFAMIFIDWNIHAIKPSQALESIKSQYWSLLLSTEVTASH